MRIEVNLPANGDQKTYDAIFQSIRKNLIDSEQFRHLRADCSCGGKLY